MYERKLFQSILVVALLITVLTSLPTLASQPTQDKGPGGVGIQSIPTETIENSYIKALTSEGGRFIIGTTGGDPGTPNDDSKRLLFGYPYDVGTSFSTLRIINGGTTRDYRLGSVDWSSSGLVPIAPPTSDGTTITTVWEQDGIRVEERLYFAQNFDTGRFDTTAIEYTIKNNNFSSCNVGLRIMLDVMVGSNDGAPYFVLGTGQVTQQFEWTGANIPDYWIAYESAIFDNDGLKGRGQLAGGNATRPNRFVVADWPQAHSTVWDYTVDPSDPVTNDSATLLYYNPTTLGPGQTKTYRTYYGIAKSGVAAQLELTGLEVTQGIQSLLTDSAWEWNDPVVLIQDKPAFVRAHVQSTSRMVSDVTAELVGRRGGSELPGSPLRPANVGGNVDVKGQSPQPNRVQLNDSFYFELPQSWRNGTVEFEFRGDSHTFVCKDHADTDNDCKVEITFEETPVLETRLVGIVWHEGDGTRHEPTAADYREVAQDIAAMFPIPRMDWDSPYELEYRLGGRPPLLLVNTRLAEQRVLDGCISWSPVNCQRIYVGILKDPQLPGVVGLGGIPPAVASGYYLSWDPSTHPHELGHVLGRSHTNCNGDEAGADANYPYADGHISQSDEGDYAFFGFDISTKRIYGPSTGDLMSYCPTTWPSKWTYEHIRDAIVDRFEASHVSNMGSAPVPSLLVMVSGVVSPTQDEAEIESVYVTDFGMTPSLPSPGAYALRFENSLGQTLATYSFQPEIGTSDGCVGCALDGSEEPVGAFALLLPWDADATRIALLHDGSELDSRLASAHAPTVNVTYPNGGESLGGSTATLSWSANDPDGDPLEYVVQYSTDAGTNWQTLVSAWPSTTYELNLDTIAGTDQGLLRVLASDGFHTSQDQSDGTFTVAKHPPQANIQTPENNRMYVGDQTIVLEGSAFDNEDGQLGDAALSWSSNLDGALGTGQSLPVVASILTEGTHTITLTAQDSDGQTGTTNIIVHVYRERPTLPTSLAVAPDALGFVAVEDGGQTAWQILSIRNDGDGTMMWSATADQSWVLVSSLGGTAPTDIIIAADPTGLLVGEYTGNITVSAPGAVNSPQTVEVTLNVRGPYVVYLPLVLR